MRRGPRLWGKLTQENSDKLRFLQKHLLPAHPSIGDLVNSAMALFLAEEIAALGLGEEWEREDPGPEPTAPRVLQRKTLDTPKPPA